MRKVRNKKGFTLLELMLSIAIIMLISGLLLTFIITIKESFMTVYNQNDSADYAMLQARGFEQSFLGNALNGEDDYTYTIKDNKLQCNNHPVFEPSQAKTDHGTKDKWKIVMAFNYDSTTHFVKYKIWMQDNYYNPGKLAYIIENGLLLPHQDREIELTGSEIEPNYYTNISVKQT